MRAIAGCAGMMAEPGLKAMKRGSGPSEEYRGSRCCLMSSRGGKASAGENGSVLVWDGELKNSGELKALLGIPEEDPGRLILQAYQRWGTACAEKLRGIYAIAVWEEARERLFLLRDRMGVRPLFYLENGGNLIFASEIKGILDSPGMSAVLDEEGLLQLVMLGPGRKPGSGVFRGIRELEPGCFGIWEQGRLRVQRYWRLQVREHGETFEQTAEHVRQLVWDSAMGQMEENMGTFLSGGLDSSILTALASRWMKQRGTVLQTFSVDYLNNDIYFRPGKFQPDSDEAYVHLMSESAGTSHRRSVLTAGDLYRGLEEAMMARDLPGMADVDSSLLAFAREVRRSVSTAMSGECADELFGGYPWYQEPQLQDGFPWARNIHQRALLLRRHRDRAEEYARAVYAETVREADLPPDCGDRDLRLMMHLNLRWFMQTLLDRNDRMSAAAGLEVKVPFCDPVLADYLYNVPWVYKNYGGREKGLLRHAFRDLLPREILGRRKSPYPKTFDPGYGELVGKKLETLLKTESPLWELLDQNAVKTMLSVENTQPWYGQLMQKPQVTAWLLQLELWLKRYGVVISD